ncbi:MAG: amidohydrolase family protein, partial [Deltaproteobacteria bacterium]|nr:amidohydrolase family protein [Deltaproteobacteria bacterium]
QDEKLTGFGCANMGLIGMETALPVCLKLVGEKKLSLKRLIESLTTGPAKIFALPGGGFKKGSPADVTIFDPAREVTVQSENFSSKSRNTPWEGMKLKGKVLFTVCAGRVVWES